jgi:hypothetical protein
MREEGTQILGYAKEVFARHLTKFTKLYIRLLTVLKPLACVGDSLHLVVTLSGAKGL